MGMNPDTNEFEKLMRESQAVGELIKAEKGDGPQYTNDEAKLRVLKEEVERHAGGVQNFHEKDVAARAAGGEPYHLPETQEEREARVTELARDLRQPGAPGLVRPDGSPVPDHWTVFAIDEHVVIKNYVFKVAHIGEKHILFEPVGPVIVGEDKTG